VDPLVELLDRQVDFLLGQADSAAFLIQVEPLLRALRTEPRLAAYLDDVLEEVVQIVGAMEEVDGELTSELVELRRELVELRPEADDSNLEPPSESDSRELKLQGLLSYRGTLAYFDEWAGSEPEPFNADGEGGWLKRSWESSRTKTPPTCMKSRQQPLARTTKLSRVAKTFQRRRSRQTKTRRTAQGWSASTRGDDGLGTCSVAMTTPYVS
jgi:hypothetical protein